jgi:hypothetical protein
VTDTNIRGIIARLREAVQANPVENRLPGCGI